MSSNKSAKYCAVLQRHSLEAAETINWTGTLFLDWQFNPSTRIAALSCATKIDSPDLGPGVLLARLCCAGDESFDMELTDFVVEFRFDARTMTAPELLLSDLA